MESIELEHEWTHERQIVRVERITVQKIVVRFPIVGSSNYELDLKTNTMRAVSAATRRKHPFCLWRAAEIEMVRRAVWIHLHPDDNEVKKSYQRHVESMPRAKKV